MPMNRQQRIVLMTMLAAASTALVAQEEAGAQPADADADAGAAGARGAESTPGGLAGNWADTSGNVLARADLLPTEGNTGHGTVTFERAPDRDVALVNVSLFGLEPGQHGFHVHENGDCSGPDAAAAGDHLNPTGAPHGGPDSPAGEHHLGDLGNLTADDQGIIEDTLESRDLMRDGELAVVGRAVVVHANADDLESQPSGQSGDPVSCGVIRAGQEITREQGEGRAAPESPQVQNERPQTQRRPAG